MDVNPGQIDLATAHARIQLRRRRWSPLWPGGVVPAVAQDDAVLARRGFAHAPQALPQAVGTRKIQSGEGQARRGEMHVRIDEGR